MHILFAALKAFSPRPWALVRSAHTVEDGCGPILSCDFAQLAVSTSLEALPVGRRLQEVAACLRLLLKADVSRAEARNAQAVHRIPGEQMQMATPALLNPSIRMGLKICIGNQVLNDAASAESGPRSRK